jgi:TonB family protein
MILQRVEQAEWLSNAYLVTDEPSGATVLIDSNGVIEPLLERVDREGLDLTHILLTHDHWDHVVGLGELAKERGIPKGEQEQSGTGQHQSDQGEVRSGLGEGRLTFSEMDALRRQIGRCWTLPVGADRIEGMVVRLRIQVRPDRTVQQVSIQDGARMTDPTFRAVAESARRAVDRCSPLQLPPGKYSIWRDIVMSFHPEDAISG